jgi:transposase
VEKRVLHHFSRSMEVSSSAQTTAALSSSRQRPHDYDVVSKTIIVHVLDTLKTWRLRRIDLAYGTLSELCAELTGVGHATVERFDLERRVTGFLSKPKRQRTQKHTLQPEHVVFLRSTMLNFLACGVKCNVSKLSEELERVFGITCRTTILLRTIHKLGFRWRKGYQLFRAHESISTVAYREAYATAKLANSFRHIVTRDQVPIQPEIYLDETYVEESHNTGFTWCFKSVPFALRSRGNKYIIVGAGVVINREGHPHGEWVKNSLQIWNPKSRKPGTFAFDYHGNMNAGNFEKWFARMCEQALTDYGPCRIHLDGCSSHKRRIDGIPTSADKKETIKKYMLDNKLLIDENDTKAQLLERLRKQYIPKQYEVRRIAESYGHTVWYTPPYSPELQPIEIIWACAKNALNESRHQNFHQFGTAVREAFNTVITSETWVGAWHKARLRELEYCRASDNEHAKSDSDQEQEEEAYSLAGTCTSSSDMCTDSEYADSDDE